MNFPFKAAPKIFYEIITTTFQFISIQPPHSLALCSMAVADWLAGADF